VSRLFGRGKKPTPQEPQPPVSTTVNEFEDEGFTVVNPSTPARADVPIYPSLGSFPQPSGSQGESKGPSLGTSGANISHYLDGVPFALTCQCSFGGDQVRRRTRPAPGPLFKSSLFLFTV
jgi:hypothetical protein